MGYSLVDIVWGSSLWNRPGSWNKGSRVKKKKVSEDWASAEATGLGKELGRKAVTIGVRSGAVLKL